MNAREAAYAVKHFFSHAKVIVPLHMGKGSTDDFDFDGFKKMCEDLDVEGVTFIHPKEFYGGKAILE